MDALRALYLAGRKKCGCDREGLEKRPKYYMKIGLPGGERYWCEKCTDVLPEAVHLDNSVCRTPDCNKQSFYTNDGTRDNRICGECRNKLTKDEQNKYKNVVNPKCLTCEKTTPSYVIVPEGKTYKDVRPVLCKTCVGKLPKDEQNKYEDVVHPKCLTCEKTTPSYAIVPEGKTYKDVQPVLCKMCVGKLPKDEQNKYEDVRAKRCRKCKKTQPVYAIVPEGKTYLDVQPVLCKTCVDALPADDQAKYKNVVNPRCQHEGCDTTANYAEDFTGFPKRYCARHAPIGFVCVNMKLCDKCETNTVAKNKVPGVCARCDPESNYAKYENAVLDVLKEKYEIVTQFPVYGEGRTKYPLRLDGAMFADDVIVAIEVDEKNGHNSAENKKLDEARMKVCGEYFEKKYSLPVAWIRIVPDISDKSLGKVKDQFGDIANRIRSEIVDRAMAKIDDVLKNPAGGVFYFRQ